ncbi:MAG: 50S ribosomal protein L10 [Candidatus Micrarchaeota archaeon]|nr:50S ribosomal protein L10 [Candidatus Micrarchaeota archaeon]
MALTKDQKKKFVEEHRKELQKYSLVGIIPLSKIPDRLLQSTKFRLKPNVKFILGRKTLLTKILEGSEKTKLLTKELQDTSAIILSNEDPFELYKTFKANVIKLAAKPNQAAPVDVHIEAGETSIQPGQAVTDLKTAGIDVQIQKGKVVIAKDKIIVKKGDLITTAVSKALHTLDIKPFSAVIEPSVLFSGNMMFRKNVLGITQEQTVSDIAKAFNSALTLSIEAKILNQYTVARLITQAYNTAMYVGIEAKLYDSGIIEKLLAEAYMKAAALNNLKPE